MARIVPALVTLALLLGGCVASDPPAESGPGVVPAASKDDAKAEPAPASTQPPASNGTSSTPSGGASTAPPPSTNATAEEPAAPVGPRTKEVAGKGAVKLVVGTPCDTPAPAPCQPGVDAEPVHLALPEKGPSASKLTVTWTAVTEATTTLRFDVTDADGLALGSGEGPSPLEVALPADAMRNVGEVVVRVVPPTPGAVANQEFDLLLSLTYGG